MVFKLFNKKKKCQIQDAYFLELKWTKELGEKNAEIQAIIESVDKETSEQSDLQLKKGLPYLTFKQAETLFLQLKSYFILQNRMSEFPIERLAIVSRNDKGQPSTEGEVFASPFLINDDYQNLLKPLVEAILNQEDFSEYTYDQKRLYFLDTIYPAYIEGLQADQSVLPIFPTEESIDGHMEVVVPAFTTPRQFDEVDEFEENYEEELVQDNESYEETFAIETEKSQDTYHYFDDSLQEGQASRSFDQDETSEYDQKRFSSVDDYLPSSKGNYEEGVIDEISPLAFKRFVIDSFEKHEYEAHESHYVAWRINAMKRSLNDHISEKEQLNNQMAEAALTKQLTIFEQTELKVIQEVVSAADKRASIKSSVLSQMKVRQRNELAERLLNLDSEKNEAIDQERKRHEKALQQIEQRFSTQKVQVTESVRSSYFEEARTVFQERYYGATAELQKILEDELNKLSLKKQIKQKEITMGLQDIGRKVGKELYDKHDHYLKSLKVQLVQEHEYAKRLQLVKRQEAAKKQSEYKVLTQNQELQDQIKRLREEQDKKFESLKEQQSKEKEALLHEKIAFLEDVITKKPKAVNEEISVAPKLTAASAEDPSTSNFFKKNRGVLMSAAVILLVGGTLAFLSQNYFMNRYQETVSILSKKTTILEDVVLEKDLETESLVAENQSITTEKIQKEEALQTASSKIEELTEQINALETDLAEATKGDIVTFPIVMGGTPTDQVFTGRVVE